MNYKSGRFGTRIDFISVHCKAGYPKDTNPNTDVMFDWVKRYSALIKNYPEFNDVEFINDESDIVWDGNLGVWMKSWLNFRNTHYAPGISFGAYAKKAMPAYLIWRKENGKEFVRISESNVNNTATFTDMTARPGVCYTYAVEAENYSGKRSGLSPEITID